MTGVKYVLGTAVIPAVTTFITKLTDMLFITDKVNANLLEGADSYQDYASSVVKATQEEIKNNEIIQVLGVVFPQLTLAIFANTVKTANLTEQEYKLGKGLYNIQDEGTRAKDAMERFAEQGVRNAEQALGDLYLGVLADQDAWEDTSKAVDGTKTSLDLLNGSMDELTLKMLYQKAAARLDTDAALALARGFGILNEDTFYTLGRLDELRAKFDTNRDGAIDASEATQEYVDAVLALSRGVDLLKDKTIHIKVQQEIFTSYSGYNSPIAPVLGGENIANASGGSFVMPDWVGHEGWPVGPGQTASGGERVIILPKTMSAGPMTNNYSNANNYNLSVMTSQSPQVVQQSFAMMKLLAG